MKLLADESGQGILEYGLILGLIAMIAIGAFLVLGSNSGNSLNNSAKAIARPDSPFAPATP